MHEKRVFAWILCMMWMGVIFAMSAVPGDVSGAQSGSIAQMLLSMLAFFFGERAQAFAPGMLELLVRKGAHMAEYAILFLLYRRALRLSGAKRPGITALCMCAAYAATDEFHQGFVEGRGPSVIDVGIDTLGGAAAATLVRIRGMRRKNDETRCKDEDAKRSD